MGMSILQQIQAFLWLILNNPFALGKLFLRHLSSGTRKDRLSDIAVLDPKVPTSGGNQSKMKDWPNLSLDVAGQMFIDYTGDNLPSIALVTMSGLTDGAAVMGDHAGISVPFPAGVTAWTSQAWGTEYNDTTYGSGANPTDFTSGTDSNDLFFQGVGNDGNMYRSRAPIRFALGTINNIADGQTWTVDDTSTTLDGSASGSNLTFTYAMSGAPTGVTINSAGQIPVDPTEVASGTISYTATDQYGRVLQGTFTFTSALRAPATAAGGLGPFTFVTSVAIVSQNLALDFTANGNTLSFEILGGPPQALSVSTAGLLTGTATTSATTTAYTARATDEYGRTTDSTFDIAVDAFPALSGASLSSITSTTATYTSQLNVDGVLHRLVSTNASETATAIKAVASVAATAATNVVLNITGLAAETQFYVHEIGIDGQGNETVIDVTSGTTLAAPVDPLVLNSITLTDGSGGTPPSVLVDDTYSGSDDLDLVLALSSSGTAPSKAQIDAGTGGGVLETATIQLGVGSVTLEDAYTSATDGATHAHGYLVERTDSAVFSGIASDAFDAPVDAIAPTLSTYTIAAGDAEAVISWATSEANTTLYLLSQPVGDAAPADADAVIDNADSSHVAVSSGAQTDITLTSLTNGVERTTYAVLLDDWGIKSIVYDADYTPALPAAGPTFIKREYIDDTLTVGGTDAATLTGYFDGSGTFFISIHDVANNNDHGYALTGPTVTAVTALQDTTASTGSVNNRSNTFAYLVTVSGAGDLTCTITGTGTSFNRVVAQTQVDGRTATGAITGENKADDVGASGIDFTALAVPTDYHVLVAYSNRTGSGTGTSWTNGITSPDHSAIFDATSSTPNFAAGGSTVTTSTGSVTVNIVLVGDDEVQSTTSGVIVALGAA